LSWRCQPRRTTVYGLCPVLACRDEAAARFFGIGSTTKRVPPSQPSDYDRGVTRELAAWNGRKFVVSGVATWALLVSLTAWVAYGLSQLADWATEVPYWLQTSLFLFALPSLLTLLALPIFGRRD
jgi:hypothetical protein